MLPKFSNRWIGWNWRGFSVPNDTSFDGIGMDFPQAGMWFSRTLSLVWVRFEAEAGSSIDRDQNRLRMKRMA